MDRVADIFAGITTVALVTTIVASPNTRRIITAVGNAYARSLQAAMGN